MTSRVTRNEAGLHELTHNARSFMHANQFRFRPIEVVLLLAGPSGPPLLGRCFELYMGRRHVI